MNTEEGREMLSAGEAARLLGISARMVYSNAAPKGPIPCYRFGGRVSFDRRELAEYKASFRCTEIKKRVVSSLNSTDISTGGESGLESVFQRLGIKPRRTPSTDRSPRASTPSRPASNVLSLASRMPSRNTLPSAVKT